VLIVPGDDANVAAQITIYLGVAGVDQQRAAAQPVDLLRRASVSGKMRWKSSEGRKRPPPVWGKPLSSVQARPRLL